MKLIVAGHAAVTADDFIELALGTPVELWLGVEGESEEERAARLDAARDILADNPHLADVVSRVAAEAIEARAPELFNVVPIPRPPCPPPARPGSQEGGRGMNETHPTLGGLTVPLAALRLLAVDFPHLPAPEVRVSALFPQMWELSLHGTSCGGSFAFFELWRNALGIDWQAVDFHTQGDGRTVVLRAGGTFAGAEIYLIAYASATAEQMAQAGGAG